MSARSAALRVAVAALQQAEAADPRQADVVRDARAAIEACLASVADTGDDDDITPERAAHILGIDASRDRYKCRFGDAGERRGPGRWRVKPSWIAAEMARRRRS